MHVQAVLEQKPPLASITMIFRNIYLSVPTKLLDSRHSARLRDLVVDLIIGHLVVDFEATRSRTKLCRELSVGCLIGFLVFLDIVRCAAFALFFVIFVK